MKRASAKRAMERRPERRKKPREKKRISPRAVAKNSCSHCSKDLNGKERALFVEEDVGRIFCSEECITSYFTPEIERLEKEYFHRLAASDLSGDEKEKLAHLRWITLQEPDEVWREKTISGDYRFTMISEFQPEQKKIWCVCMCLFLRGEPSFLYLAFPTKNAAMVNAYRRGERVQWMKPPKEHSAEVPRSDDDEDEGAKKGEILIDGLADAWTEDETLRAQLIQERRKDDIPIGEFSLYQGCLEETLETPDEVWSMEVGTEDPVMLYHFIREYPDENPGVWFIIVARETEEDDQIELLDAFPTRDSELVDRYRRGKQEIGKTESRPVSRVVH